MISIFSFVDEMVKIGGYGRSMGIGSAVGAGLGAAGVTANELRLRDNEEGTKPSSELKKIRKGRLKYIAGSTALGAAAGTGLGAGAHKAKLIARRGIDGTMAKAKSTASDVVDNALDKA